MDLKTYFSNLIKKVETSDTISNGGKDNNGFYKPTRTILLNQLNLLKDLHAKPNAKKMVTSAWAEVVKVVPAEWLILDDDQKNELKKILGH